MKPPFVKYESGECTLELFTEMCKQHDLTYAFSDDNSVWRTGYTEMTLISDAAIRLGQPAKDIWNSVVKEKLSPDHQQPFLW